MKNALKLATAFGIACLLTSLGAQQNSTKQGRSTMKLELNLPRELYLTGEKVNVDVRLTNTGQASVSAPLLDRLDASQPVYVLRGPSYPSGVSFNRRGDSPVSASQQPTDPLGPGETFETGFDITALKPIAEPGEYSLSARIESQGLSAEAAPVQFRIEKAKFLESSLGVDVYASSTRTLRAVWIADVTGKRLLGESFLYESRPDLGEVKVNSTRIIHETGLQATTPFGPWVNFDRMGAVKYWHGWQEGQQLLVFSDDESKPRTFDIGSRKARIVQPTLMTKSGELNVLILGENRKTLQMIRFRSEMGPPDVAWTAALPEEAAGFRLGVGSAAEGGSRVAASISQIGDKLAIRLIRIGDRSAEIGAPSTISGFVLPDSEPSIAIAGDGSVHVTAVFARDPSMRSIGVTNLAWRDGKGEMTISDVGMTESAVTHAWAAHDATSDRPATGKWLVRTAKGYAGGGDRLNPVAIDGEVTALLRMSASTYVLALSATRGAALVATDF